MVAMEEKCRAEGKSVLVAIAQEIDQQQGERELGVTSYAGVKEDECWIERNAAKQESVASQADELRYSGGYVLGTGVKGYAPGRAHYPPAVAEMPEDSTLAEGTKNDAAKLPMHLVPPEAIEAMAEVLQYGAEKYAPRNWEKGIAYSRLYAATMRHLLLWWQGSDLDQESGLEHVNHALTNLGFLATFIRQDMWGPDLDDRP